MSHTSRLIIASIAAATLLLTACGSSKQTPGGKPVGASGPQTTPTSDTAGAKPGAAQPSAAPVAWSCPTDLADEFTLGSGGDTNVQDLWQQTLLPAWEKACPNIKVRFVFDTHSQNANLDVAKVGAAIKAGQDVPVDVTDNISLQAMRAELTEKLTTEDVPSMAKVAQDTLTPYDYAGVPYRASAVLLAYNSEKVASPPKTLADLLTWIKDNPGKFTYNTPDTGGSGNSFVMTVVGSKMDPAALKKMEQAYDPALSSNFDAGLDLLSTLTPNVYEKTYPKGNQAVLDLLAKGEIDIAPVWSDQFLSAQKKGLLGKEFKVEQISEPSFTGSPTYLAIIKSTKHKKAAASFIEWVLQPQQQAVIVSSISGFPAIPISDLPADTRSAFADVDTQQLRTELESKTQADLKKAWATKVAAG